MNTDNIIDNAIKTNVSFKRNPYYIYDLVQVNWMLEQGCIPLQVGKGEKNDVFLKFPRTPEVEEIVYKWKLKNKRLSKYNL